MEILPHSFRLLPLPPVELYQRGADCVLITAIFAAVLTKSEDKFAIGALGAWLPLAECLQAVSPLPQSLSYLLLLCRMNQG